MTPPAGVTPFWQPPPPPTDSSNWRVEQDYVDYTTILLVAGMCIAGMLAVVGLSQLAFLFIFRACFPRQARAQLGSNLFGRSLGTHRWRRRSQQQQQQQQLDKLQTATEDADAAAEAATAVELKRHTSV